MDPQNLKKGELYIDNTVPDEVLRYRDMTPKEVIAPLVTIPGTEKDAYNFWVLKLGKDNEDMKNINTIKAYSESNVRKDIEKFDSEEK